MEAPARLSETRRDRRGPDLGAIAKHPLRAACWTLLADGPKSPKELSDLLREPVQKVAYHVRELRDAGVIELCREVPNRGSVEHFYRVTERPLLDDANTETRTVQERNEYARFCFQRLVADATFSLDEGVLGERPDHWVVRFPLQLDEEGWKEIHNAYDQLTETIIGVQAATAQREAERCGEAETIRVTAFASYFEVPEPENPLAVKRA